MTEDKKRAAAVSAVLTYLQQEEEMHPPTAAPTHAALQAPNLWGLSGRQALMQFRNLMQMKTFHRFR